MDQNALFLGGSKGLGFEMAKLAVSEGMHTTIAARRAEHCPLVREGSAGWVVADLESEAPNMEMICALFPKTPLDLIVWTAGAYQEGHFLNLTDDEIVNICRLHLEGPALVLKRLLNINRRASHPCQVIVTASSASYRVRPNEGMYSPIKAGKAQFARMLGQELPTLIPGSKILLAHPGGMRTPFWEKRERDISRFMDPAEVALLIWNEMKAQKTSFDEIHIDRQPDGSAKLARDIRPPQF